MDKVLPPRKSTEYPDRDLECEEAMDAALRDVLDAGNAAGWSTPEMLSAIERVVPFIRVAYEADPDPADDPA